MSARPQFSFLKEDLHSNLQKIFGVSSLHSKEGSILSKNLATPHPESTPANSKINNYVSEM